MPNKVAVVLSGGAPNGALTAGALYGIYEKGHTFHAFHTSGAGAAFGLAFVAARGLTPDKAVQAMIQVGIHDAIYAWVPLGYKTFYKSGPFTKPMVTLASSFKFKDPDTDGKRFYNDWIDLWTAAFTPTTVNYFSQGLCAHYPLLTEAIDFGKLHAFAGEFQMNAYCIEDAAMVEFTKPEITADHFFAALSYPFIYPPTKIGNKHYYEGSALEPLDLELENAGDHFGKRKHDKTHWGGLKKRVAAGTIDDIVVIDLLGPMQKALIRTPKNLLDAYGISIMTPVVSLAVTQRELFLERHPEVKQKIKNLKFEIPPNRYDTLCDWSASNLTELFEIGRAAGQKFCDDHPTLLPKHAPNSADPV